MASYEQLKGVLNNMLNKFYYKLAYFCLIVISCVLILKFNIFQCKIDKQQHGQLENFTRALMNVKKIAQIEWDRHNNMKKIITIIDRYNSKMEYDLKQKIANEIYEMSNRYRNLDIDLICATITHETAQTWNPKIVSPANAIGMMQIIPATGFFLAKEEGIEFRKIEGILSDPIINIRLGCRYLSSLIAAYNIDGGLAAYNGGMKRAEKWVRNGRIKGILHEETEYYVPSILKFYEQYQQMTI